MNKKSDVKNIINRASQAKEGTQAFYSLYKRCYELAAPNANNVDPGSSKGQTRQPSVYDSTVARAADSFVNTFISTVFPPQTRWAELEPSQEIISAISEQFGKDEEDVREELTAFHQAVTDKFFDALNQSNFYSITDQLSLDTFVGTCCVLVQESNDLFDSASPLDFTAIPPLDISVELAPNKKITGVFRSQTMKYSQIQMMWPEFDLSVISQRPSGDSDDFSKEFTEACILEPVAMKMPNGETQLLRWRYCVIVDSKIGYERYYKTNPFVVFFWSLLHGESVGRGLMTKVLPDANELQAMVNLKNKWLQMYGLGMTSIVPSKLLNASSIKIRPNIPILVKEQDAIRPITPAGSPQIQQMHIEELKQGIKESALDFTIPTDPNMTATQVNYIAQRQLQIFAGVVGRIQFQFLWPIVQNSINILIEKGIIPQMPFGLDKISSYTTKLKILSPIGRVQNLNDLNAVISALGYIGQIDPNLIPLHIKTEDLPTWIFSQTGSPAKFLRSEEETSAIQAQQAEQAQQQQAMEMAMQMKNK